MPFTHLHRQCANPDQLRAFVDATNTQDPYHRMDFGGGFAIEGEFDLGKVIHQYRIPESLVGKTVMDVGTYNGYLALYCAVRGGRVTAVDIYEPPGFVATISQLFDVPIEYRKCNIYDLNSGAGQFDLVICGSLLLHLLDPVGALQRLRTVCKGQVIVSTGCMADSATNPAKICEFVGTRHESEGGSYWQSWSLSAAALRQMLLAAGFARIDWEDHFDLISEPSKNSYSIRHVIMAASI